MNLTISFPRFLLASTVLFAALFPDTSRAVLLAYELRAVPVGSSPDVVLLDSHFVYAGPGDVITLQLYAIVANTDGNYANDGFLRGSGSLVSSGGSSLYGTTFGNLRGDTVGGAASLQNNLAPFSGPGAQSGFQTDLDGDGDLDLGSLTTTGNPAGPPWFIAEGAGQQTQFGAGTGTNPTQFLIGQFTFTVTGATSGTMATEPSTNISFEPQVKTDGTPAEQMLDQFTVDGVSYAVNGNDFSAVATAAPVSIHAAPEPSSCALALCGALALAGFRRRR